jgi:hypothetical protein
MILYILTAVMLDLPLENADGRPRRGKSRAAM